MGLGETQRQAGEQLLVPTTLPSVPFSCLPGQACQSFPHSSPKGDAAFTWDLAASIAPRAQDAGTTHLALQEPQSREGDRAGADVKQCGERQSKCAWEHRGEEQGQLMPPQSWGMAPWTRGRVSRGPGWAGVLGRGRAGTGHRWGVGAEWLALPVGCCAWKSMERLRFILQGTRIPTGPGDIKAGE